MVSCEIWEKHALMSFSKTQIELVLRAILYVFEKLTRACFSQIALETILLPILICQYLIYAPCPSITLFTCRIYRMSNKEMIALKCKLVTLHSCNLTDSYRNPIGTKHIKFILLT